MPSITDAINAENENGEILENQRVIEEYEEEAQAPKVNIDLKEILTRPTGEGEISDYINHILNFNKSEEMARILRGLTGFFQKSFNFAVLDIIIGTYQLMAKTKGAKPNVNMS